MLHVLHVLQEKNKCGALMSLFEISPPAIYGQCFVCISFKMLVFPAYNVHTSLGEKTA